MFDVRTIQLHVVALVALGVCSNSCTNSSNTTRTTCDALAAHETPTSLTSLLGVAKDGDGVLYVADEGDAKSGGPRVFVSSGTALYRKRLAGAGSSGGGGDADYALGFTDGSTRRDLVIQIRAGKVTGMALSSGGGKMFFDDLGSDAVHLQVLDTTAVKGLAVHNLPGEVAIEYLARTKTGETLLVTRPEDDSTYEDFQVFYGAGKALLERNVSMVTRAKDGGSTTIDFEVDGDEYAARFPVTFDGTQFTPGPATLDTPKSTLPLTREEPVAKTLVGFSYQCFE